MLEDWTTEALPTEKTFVLKCKTSKEDESASLSVLRQEEDLRRKKSKCSVKDSCCHKSVKGNSDSILPAAGNLHPEERGRKGEREKGERDHIYYRRSP